MWPDEIGNRKQGPGGWCAYAVHDSHVRGLAGRAHLREQRLQGPDSEQRVLQRARLLHCNRKQAVRTGPCLKQSFCHVVNARWSLVEPCVTHNLRIAWELTVGDQLLAQHRDALRLQRHLLRGARFLSQKTRAKISKHRRRKTPRKTHKKRRQRRTMKVQVSAMNASSGSLVAPPFATSRNR